jgi:hypothetical protein
LSLPDRLSYPDAAAAKSRFSYWKYAALNPASPEVEDEDEAATEGSLLLVGATAHDRTELRTSTLNKAAGALKYFVADCVFMIMST